MSVQINNKIVGYSVVDDVEDESLVETPAVESTESSNEDISNVIQMHEKLERPDRKSVV